MTADAPVPGWDAPAAAFLAANLPRIDEGRPGWDHMFSTAYQIGCKALVALGEATEEARGAVPRVPPVRPDVLPRWDDVAVAVLWLAHQRNRLAWRQPDGSLPPPRQGGFVVRQVGAPLPPPPTIAAAHGGGPAHAGPEVMETLAALGLVTDGAWTPAAEPVLWRCQPQAWAMAVTGDPRFAAALDRCIATIPAEVHDSLSGLAMVTAAQIAADQARRDTAEAEWTARFPNRRTGPAPTAEGLRRGLVFRNGNDADWLFFRRWRLPDGWLAPGQASRALEVFHDPLARAMRRAVVARLFPGSDLAAAP